MIQKIGRYLAVFLGIGLLLVGALYVVVMLINWRDQPPSPAAIAFQTFYANRPPVAEADNGYIYALGFDVPVEENPRTWGQDRVAWSHEIVKTAAADDELAYPGPAIDFADERSTETLNLAEICSASTEECAAQLAANPAAFNTWFATEKWVVDRYTNVIAHPGWLESGKLDPRIPFPAYAPVLEAQRVYLLRLWANADQMPMPALTQALNQDLEFWRVVLQHSDILITKMMAVAAIQHHFAWTNPILRRLPVETALQVIPPAAQRPFSSEELSVYRCFVGEWMFSQQSMQLLLADKSLGLISRSLIQPQDTANHHAEQLRALAERVAVPFTRLPGVLRDIDPEENHLSFFELLRYPYNFSGRVLLSISGPGLYDRYIARIHDLEGVRRALLLAARMRGAVNGEELLQESRYANPYTNEPLEWDQATRAVIFVGLDSDDEGYWFYY